jgi:shikimate kinase
VTSVDRPLFLVGFMGSGKTTVGRCLAAHLGWRFEDTDALVEAREERTVEAIFRESGEGRFREVEWAALQDLAAMPRMVVATGGGLFLGVVPRAFLKRHGVTVWLDAPLETIRERLRPAGPPRPLWGGDDPVAQRAFFEKRRAAYALADVRVDAAGGAPEQVALDVETRCAAFRR